jgi:hypothetical protein
VRICSASGLDGRNPFQAREMPSDSSHAASGSVSRPQGTLAVLVDPSQDHQEGEESSSSIDGQGRTRDAVRQSVGDTD